MIGEIKGKIWALSLTIFICLVSVIGLLAHVNAQETSPLDSVKKIKDNPGFLSVEVTKDENGKEIISDMGVAFTLKYNADKKPQEPQKIRLTLSKGMKLVFEEGTVQNEDKTYTVVPFSKTAGIKEIKTVRSPGEIMGFEVDKNAVENIYEITLDKTDAEESITFKTEYLEDTFINHYVYVNGSYQAEEYKALAEVVVPSRETYQPKANIQWQQGTGIQPVNFNLTLLDAGGAEVQTLNITENDSEVLFDSVPKFDKDNQPIPYTLSPSEVEGLTVTANNMEVVVSLPVAEPQPPAEEQPAPEPQPETDTPLAVEIPSAMEEAPPALEALNPAVELSLPEASLAVGASADPFAMPSPLGAALLSAANSTTGLPATAVIEVRNGADPAGTTIMPDISFVVSEKNTDTWATPISANPEGQVVLNNLDAGTYKFKINQDIYGFIRNTTIYELVVGADGALSITNSDSNVYYDSTANLFVYKIQRDPTKLKIIVEDINDPTKKIGNVGIEFNSGSSTQIITTNTSGIIEYTNLAVGTNTIKQQDAGSYLLNPKEYTIIVAENGTVSLSNGDETTSYNPLTGEMLFKNRKGGGFSIELQAKHDSNIKLAGAKFVLENRSSGEQIGDIKVSDSQGRLSFSNIPEGSYTLKQTGAATSHTGYKPITWSEYITVGSDGTVTVPYSYNNSSYNGSAGLLTVYNYKVYQMGIKAVDAQDPALAVQGVNVKIATAGSSSSFRDTDSDGFLYLEARVGDNYAISVYIPASGYFCNTKTYTLTVDDNGVVSIPNADDDFYYNAAENRIILKNHQMTNTDGHRFSVVLKDIQVPTKIFKGQRFSLFSTSPAVEPINDYSASWVDGVMEFKGLPAGSYRVQSYVGSDYAPLTVSVDFQVDINGVVSFSGLDTQPNTTYDPATKRLTIGLQKAYKISIETQDALNPTEKVDGTSFQFNSVPPSPTTSWELFVANTSGIVTTPEGIAPGTYTIKELEPPAHAWWGKGQGYFVHPDTYKIILGNDGSISVTKEDGTTDPNVYYDSDAGKIIFKKYKKPYNIDLVKAGMFNNTGLAGAKFQMYEDNGARPVGNVLTTDSQGKIQFTGITAGSYKLKEIQAPPGYRLDPQAYQVNVGYNGIVSLINAGENLSYDSINKYILFRNQQDFTTLKLVARNIKDLAGTGGLPEATYRITNTSTSVQQEATTDNKGHLLFTGLSAGNYTLQEITPAENYLPNTTVYQMNISGDGYVYITNADANISYDVANIEVVFKSARDPSKLTIEVRDAGDATGSTKLAGSILSLTRPVGGGGGVTGADGRKTFEYIAPGETYTLRQTTPPSGYLPILTEYSITVDAVGTPTIANADANIFYDEANGVIVLNSTRAPGLLLLEVRSAEDPTGNTRLPMARLRLSGTSGGVPFSGELISNAQGGINWGSFGAGSYKLKEIIAPQGYALNTKEYSLEIAADGSITMPNADSKVYYDATRQMIIFNNEISQSFNLIKGDRGDPTGNIRLAEAKLQLYEEDGITLRGAEVTTDTGGVAVFNGLAPGTYKLKETTAPTGYLLDEAMYTLHISNAGWVTVTENTGNVYYDPIRGGVMFKNARQPYNLTLEKRELGDATGTIKLEGAKFKVLSEEGTQIGEEQTTGTDGRLVFPNLVAGKYKLQETQAPISHGLDPKIYSLEIDRYGDVTSPDGGEVLTYDTANKLVIFKNEKAYNLALQKEDMADPTKLLENAKFQLYKTDGTTPVGTEVATGNDGNLVISGLLPGSYLLKETKAPRGYIRNNIVYQVDIAAGGVLTLTAPDENISIDGNKIIYKNVNGHYPSTGGIGGAIFVAAGLGLAAWGFIKKEGIKQTADKNK